MSYASLIKTLPEFWRSSTGLAALVSLGIHVLLFVVLPVLPFDSKTLDPQLQGNIGLIELTPSEQSRLPQTDSPAQPPSDATPPSVLPPVSPLPNVPPSYYYPPVATQSSALPPLPLPPPPVLNLPPPGVPPVYNYPNNQPLTQSPYSGAIAPVPGQPYMLRRLPPAPPLTLSANPNLPSTAGLKPAPLSAANLPSPRAQQNNNPQNTNQSQNQKVATATPVRPSRPEKLPERGKESLLAVRRKLQQRSTRNPAGSTPLATALRNTNQQLGLTQLKPANTAVRPEKLPERGREMLLTRRDKLRQARVEPNRSGSISAATVQRNTQLAAYETRQDRVYEEYPNAKTKPPIYKTLQSCQRQLAGSVAIVGVVVNPKGQIISGPDFLYKQGAAGIEQATKDYVMGYRFPKTDNSINQHFHLQFKYDTGKCSESTSK